MDYYERGRRGVLSRASAALANASLSPFPRPSPVPSRLSFWPLMGRPVRVHDNPGRVFRGPCPSVVDIHGRARERQALNYNNFPAHLHSGGISVEDLLHDLDEMSEERFPPQKQNDQNDGNIFAHEKTPEFEDHDVDITEAAHNDEVLDRVEPLGVFASRMKRLTDWRPFKRTIGNRSANPTISGSSPFVTRTSVGMPREVLSRRTFIGEGNRLTYLEERPDNMTELFKQSSIPGFREISQSKNWFRKLTWMVSSLILGLLALKDISQLLAEYFNYPITVNVRLRDSRRLPFPAVTICNLNIVRHSILCNATYNFTMPPELEEKLCKASNLASDASPPSTNPNGHIDINDFVKEAETTTMAPVTTTELADINEYGTTSPPRPAPKPPDMDGIDGEIAMTTTEETIPEVNTPPLQFERPLLRERRQAHRRRFGGAAANGPNQGSVSSTTTTISPLLESLISSTSAPNDPELELIELTEREEKELQENMTNWLAVMYNTRRNATLLLGHQFEDMVLRCTIKTHNCTHPRSFEQSFSPTEGNCFTYKSRTKHHNQERGGHKQDEASLAGVNYGLELVLNLEVKEYLPGSAQIGALVMVHHPDEFGNSASEAILIAPEQATYIGLKMVNITRLEHPYPEDCINFWPVALTGSLTQNATYSQQACLKICLQRTIQRQCACQSAMLPQLDNNSTLRICDTRRRFIKTCVDNVMFYPENKVNDCTCPPRCNVISYDKTISVAKWPTREDRVSFDRGKNNLNFQNLAKVVVYFQTMTCQEVTQQAAYTSAKLFSSLGGIMGMYLGFSFLSVFEIVEVFIRRLWHALCGKRRRRFRVAAHVVGVAPALSRPSSISQHQRQRHTHITEAPDHT